MPLALLCERAFSVLLPKRDAFLSVRQVRNMSGLLLSVPLAPLPGLEPVMAPDTRIVILCSYPGKDAFEKNEYYPGFQNEFWELMSAVLGHSLTDKSYEKRLQVLLSHGIGLWDVISACQSRGSLKTVLRETRPEQLAYLKEKWPLLGKICFNGQPSGEYAPLFEEAGFTTLVLPSSSFVYSKQSFETKLAQWLHILLVPDAV